MDINHTKGVTVFHVNQLFYCFVCSLVIATKFRAKTALLKLMELVAPSRPIVVYSPYKEVKFASRTKNLPQVVPSLLTSCKQNEI